ncbi:MAG: RNB domain-containing ribonuclease [Gemmatimonadetes bacterium]|nr:RNB domain-containing ribonuclease [Gemmatimonadota bacterium]
MPTWVRDLLSHDDPRVRSQVGRQLFGHRGRSHGHGLASGSLVEFTHGGGLWFGAVLRNPGRRLLVVDVRGRERWLRRDKILDLSPERAPTLSRQGVMSHLRRIDGQRQARSLAVDLEPLWEIAAEEGEGRVWSLDELAELQFRAPGADDRAVLLRTLWHSRFFARHPDGWSPLSRQARARRGELESLKKQQAKDLAETAAWVRRVADGEAPDPRPANADEAVRLLREAAVFGSGSRRRSEAAALMERAHLHGPGAAFDVLVRLGFWDRHENLELHRCGVPLEFSPESLDEVERIAAVVGGVSATRAWRRPCAFADPADQTADVALFARRTIRGFRVQVYLPLVAAAVPAGSALDRDAANRATSIELPDRRIPLLPPAVEGAVRFRGERAAPSLRIEAVLGRDLGIRDCRIALRRIRPRMVSPDSETEGRAAGRLRTLAEIAAGLRARRQGRLPAERVPEEDPDIRVAGSSVTVSRPDSMGRMILEECVNVASQALGAWCEKQGVPALYRTRPLAPPLPPEAGVEQQPDDPGRLRSYLLRKAGTPESMQVKPAEHEALGLSGCAAGTAPLDRYEHLVMQRQLIAAIKGGTPVGEEELERLLSECRAGIEAARRVERHGRRYWLLAALQPHQGADLEATVVRRAGVGYTVLLDRFDIEGYVAATEMSAHTGDRVMVHLQQASPRRNLLRLAGVRRR